MITFSSPLFAIRLLWTFRIFLCKYSGTSEYKTLWGQRLSSLWRLKCLSPMVKSFAEGLHCLRRENTPGRRVLPQEGEYPREEGPLQRGCTASGGRIPQGGGSFAEGLHCLRRENTPGRRVLCRGAALPQEGEYPREEGPLQRGCTALGGRIPQGGGSFAGGLHCLRRENAPGRRVLCRGAALPQEGEYRATSEEGEKINDHQRGDNCSTHAGNPLDAVG